MEDFRISIAALAAENYELKVHTKTRVACGPFVAAVTNEHEFSLCIPLIFLIFVS